MPRNPLTASAEAFLKAYAQTANITKAAEAAKLDRGLHYHWIDTNPKYQRRFLAAERMAADVIESEAVRRATEGVMEAVYYQGRAVGAVRRYSDGIMLTLLRGFKPQKYAIQKTEITGADGGPVEIIQRLNAARLRVAREDAEDDASRGTTERNR